MVRGFLRIWEAVIGLLCLLLPLGNHLVHVGGELFHRWCIAGFPQSIHRKITGFVFVHIEHPNGREAGNLKCLLEAVVLRLDIAGHLEAAREVNFQKDDVLVRPCFELLFGENGRRQSLAPATPVAASEIGHDGLAGLSGQFIGFIQIHQPPFIGSFVTVGAAGGGLCISTGELEGEEKQEKHLFHDEWIACIRNYTRFN